ncbi:nucleotidyltransferase domain-containing protein [Marinobacterium sp. AK62]|uniref:Nucleotidyltransferase domain-containing protein n=2 Tax=Marinobacterium alkalitolerans TaxID=1542925 RepID=A0ABS3ZA88_9GAMM|nr:nucleotidyltransferase domain-containing protein [Marinobacterium alkalitolerans]
MQVLHDCFLGCSDITQAVLYGSRAKGNWHDRSDVDLAVKGEQLDRFKIARLMLEIDDSDFPYPVDILHYDTLNNPRLKEHIDRVGVVIFSRN